MILGASIRLKDQFTPVMGGALRQVGTMNSKLKILSNMTVRPVVRIKDEVSGHLGRIKSGLMSVQGLAAVGLGAFGVHKLGEATLGAAMDFETQMVSMEHWLKGNKELAKEYTGWLDQFANKTSLQMEDLFPAGSRAVGISDGDVSKAERLVTLAADMAGLTPGKTVQDATEALADAQMGEFERMKEFNMKFTKEKMDAAGGFAGFLAIAEENFNKGAEKLGKTTRGRLSTIRDLMKTQFRSVGTGMLESLKPRLEKITDWFDNNQDTLTRWKGVLVQFGREGTERILSFFENTFTHIRTRYLDNPEFKSMSFIGKIDFIMADITEGFNAWFDSGGREKVQAFGQTIGEALKAGLLQVAPAIGASLGEAVMSTFTAALQSSPIGAMIVGAIPGAAVGSVVPVVGTAVGAAAGAGAGLITWGATKILGPGKNHASGLPYVPYDNYPALLHRGERVVTAADNRQYNSLKSLQPNININK